MADEREPQPGGNMERGAAARFRRRQASPPADATRRPTGAADIPPGHALAGRITWQAVLYVCALGAVSVLLVPLTDLWWIVPLLGAAAPLALALLARPRIVAGERREGGVPGRPPAAQPMGDGPDRALPLAAPGITGGQPASWPSELKAPTATGVDRDRHPTDDRQIGEAAGPGGDAPAEPLAEPLSAREIEVLAALAAGRTTAEAAHDLFVSVGTIKSHTANIYRKLGARNRAEAIDRARRLGLLP